ncbi:MAG TPA: nicotinate phosphoribosyltransferase, partial [Desulfosarcina sp.]|nr:nicotinate phosphoribosyltransferase [Desulfosarcina sp.]
FASSGFDEYALQRLISAGARIDAFGVGTRMGVSADAPYLDMVYKLVRLGDRDVRKKSEGKATLAGEKQVFRRIRDDGRFAGDVIGMRHETPEPGRPLLATVMENGRSAGPMPTLEQIRRRFADGFALLDERCKRLTDPEMYPVAVSPALAALQEGC